MSERVTFTQITVQSLVSALDPLYGKKDIGYSFSNGRKFNESLYDSEYQSLPVPPSSYTKGDPLAGLRMEDELLMLESLIME